MARWIAFPHDARDYARDADALERDWARLHRCDAEPFPEDPAVAAAWALFHAGRFQQAAEAGAAAAGAGATVANKALFVHASHLETSEKARLAMFTDIIERARSRARDEPDDANAHYWLAAALRRHGQGISIAAASAQGLDGQVKGALETAISLAPRHADAHAALGAFHAEVIDKFGRQRGKAHGADAAAGLRMFKEALALDPESAIARIEYANGLMMIDGDRRMKEAERLYAEAAACSPMDAAQRLDVERAKAQLQGE
ncbi:MAG: hypothetical protein ABW032_05585 [Burkholderiaceae bacterium]